MHLYGTMVEAFLKQHICDELKLETLASILGLGKMWVLDGRNYKKYPQTHILMRNLLFPSCCKPMWHMLLILSLEPEVILFVELRQISFCIMSWGRGMDQQLTTNQMNTEGADLKLDPTNSCTHNTKNSSWQQFDKYYIEIQKGLISMWCLESHLGIKIYALLEQQHQCVVIMPKWQDINCRNYKYRVWICEEEMFFIPLSFGYTAT